VHNQDAAGRTFFTLYDLDGKVQSVTRTDVTPSQTIVSYGYGSSGVNNGQVTSVTDGLSGVTDSFTYALNAGDPSYGQVTCEPIRYSPVFRASLRFLDHFRWKPGLDNDPTSA